MDDFASVHTAVGETYAPVAVDFDNFLVDFDFSDHEGPGGDTVATDLLADVSDTAAPDDVAALADNVALAVSVAASDTEAFDDFVDTAPLVDTAAAFDTVAL